MPRINQLPQSTTTLDNNELSAIFKDGVTEQRKLYELQSQPIDGYSSNYFFTLRSLQERTAISGIKFFSNGEEIAPSEIAYTGFSRGTNVDGTTIDIQLQGTLAGLFTDNPSNETSWKTAETDICLHVAFNNFYVINEFQITATLNAVELSPVVMKADIGEGRLFRYENYNWDSWTPGSIQKISALPLIKPLFPVGLSLRSISGDRDYSEIYDRAIIKRLNIASPFIILDDTEEIVTNYGMSEALEAYSNTRIEIQTHRQNVMTITDLHTTVNAEWCDNYANYSFTYFIMNTPDDATIEIQPSEDLTHRYSQVGVKRTIINVTGGWDVSVSFPEFDTYNQLEVTLLPGQILYYIEYEVGKVFSWSP